jgi:hypothetical protein
MDSYEGATMMKTYRGLLAADTQDHIRLKTLKGDIGYKITKFQIIGNAPGTAEVEAIVKIYKLKQSTNTSTIDFTDGDLLAAAEHREFAAAEDISSPQVIIFDREIFNQDIFITYKTAAGTMSMNYYLELEQVKLNENESTMATLQSLRRFALPRN